jgi:hypothetical protein
MALKVIFATMKHEGYVLKKLDLYLLQLEDKDEDRRWDINSPSMSSQCSRAIYYSRTGVERDAFHIDARTHRIFDNGTHYHLRMQKYLTDMGIVLMCEVPAFDKDLEIQGSADGIIKLNEHELGILELKSINSGQYAKLIDALEKHKEQAQCYMSCIEKQRQYIQSIIKSPYQLKKYLRAKSTFDYYAKMYDHLKSGSHYTREEKLNYRVGQHIELDRILWHTPRPINKMIFLYENKDTQELKEFCVGWNQERVDMLEKKFKTINRCIKKHKVPPREGKSKSCEMCRFCDFRNTCFIL